MDEIIWNTNNPLGISVILKQSTYDEHISDEPKRTELEVENLQAVLQNVKGIIEHPRFIYCDKNFEGNSRQRYLDFVFMEDRSAIRSLVVIVDTDREPNEIVTWTIKRNLSQENPSKDEIIYDSCAY